jgi:hypothetical protein
MVCEGVRELQRGSSKLIQTETRLWHRPRGFIHLYNINVAFDFNLSVPVISASNVQSYTPDLLRVRP